MWHRNRRQILSQSFEFLIRSIFEISEILFEISEILFVFVGRATILSRFYCIVYPRQLNLTPRKNVGNMCGIRNCVLYLDKICRNEMVRNFFLMFKCTIIFSGILNNMESIYIALFHIKLKALQHSLLPR